MSLDDLPLDHPAPMPRPPARGPAPAAPSPRRWVIAGAFAVILAALLTLWWMSRTQTRTAIPAPTHATDVTVGSNRPKRTLTSLPGLDDSDTLLRELIAQLSKHPLIARLLATKGIVREAALAVEQIGDGRTPALPLKALRPNGKLTIVGGGETGHVDPLAYKRWNEATATLLSINPADAAQLYVNVKPLFDDAYRELGHPDGDFDASIVRAIQMLNDTPVVTADPELIKRPSYYEHADPTLRSLPPVQKQLLLVGPENRERILSWLKRLANALDLKT